MLHDKCSNKILLIANIRQVKVSANKSFNTIASEKEAVW
jgi:hypothetical protein